jgi:hypothetical protein
MWYSNKEHARCPIDLFAYWLTGMLPLRLIWYHRKVAYASADASIGTNAPPPGD